MKVINANAVNKEWYNVILEKEKTVEDIINYVLIHRSYEFGYFKIYDAIDNKEMVCDIWYPYNVAGNIPLWVLKANVKRVWALGNYGRMDYNIIMQEP